MFCVAAQWKDGIANSHKNYRGNVELFGGGCFSSGQHDKGSSNFTDNHCFVGKESALLLFQFPNVFSSRRRHTGYEFETGVQ
eukprot:COSAG03_NODE_18279_length_358_cov_0.864865_1_plen_81_part_01